MQRAPHDRVPPRPRLASAPAPHHVRRLCPTTAFVTFAVTVVAAVSPPTGDHGTSAPPCAVDVVEDFNGQPVPTEGRGPVLGPRRLIAVHGRERARLEWFAILQTRADDQAVALSTAPR